MTECCLSTQLTSRRYPKLKEVDEVLGGAAAWDNVDKTQGELWPLMPSCLPLFLTSLFPHSSRPHVTIGIFSFLFLHRRGSVCDHV